MDSDSTAITVSVERADAADLESVTGFLQPFIDARCLLPRTTLELAKLLECAFIARASDGRVAGFAALEIYSRKLSEIQCLAVSPDFRRRGIGRLLVKSCVAAAKKAGVVELMAISSAEPMFTACGFDYSLPDQKRAFFISPQEAEIEPEDSTDSEQH
ncbi:MAG: GNAT family N-acetyltransferase [Planctomycetota bacterium]